jgi:hypothetical protein
MDGTEEHQFSEDQKIVYSPSYVDFKSQTNAAMLLDLGHIKGRAHTGGMGIGGKPKT